MNETKTNNQLHTISGRIAWVGDMQAHPSEIGEMAYTTRKIKVETIGGKFTDSAYLLLRGDMALHFRWNVGDTVEAHYNMRAYETKYGTTANCLVCWQIKNTSNEIVM